MNIKRTSNPVDLAYCGKNTVIENGVGFKNAQKISVGKNVSLRYGCNLYVVDNTTDANLFDLPIAIKIGNGVHIKEYVNFSTYGGYINIGNNTGIGQNSVLYGHGGIEIGANVLISPNCSIVAVNHNFDDNSRNINTQGTNARGIIIEDDVWIGANVVILDSVHIGKGAVIGAGAVVSKNIAAYCVAYGNPAIVQRRRGK